MQRWARDSDGSFFGNQSISNVNPPAATVNKSLCAQFCSFFRSNPAVSMHEEKKLEHVNKSISRSPTDSDESSPNSPASPPRSPVSYFKV